MKAIHSPFNSKLSVLLVVCTLFMLVLFETSQQLWFIKTYELFDDVSFMKLLPRQILSWLAWLIFLTGLFLYTKKQEHYKEIIAIDTLVRYFLVINLLVFLCILMISIIRMLMTTGGIELRSLVTEYIPFFFYQKAPIFMFGYIAMVVIFQLDLRNKYLNIRIQELSEIKNTNLIKYQELREKHNDKTSVLNIKVGNKYKIIPVKDISWIEADNYCVRIHSNNNIPYNMRTSLKALDERLGQKFLRVHRGAIVNMDMAQELDTTNLPKLILSTGAKVQVSKRYLKEVKSFLS